MEEVPPSKWGDIEPPTDLPASLKRKPRFGKRVKKKTTKDSFGKPHDQRAKTYYGEKRLLTTGNCVICLDTCDEVQARDGKLVHFPGCQCRIWICRDTCLRQHLNQTGCFCPQCRTPLKCQQCDQAIRYDGYSRAQVYISQYKGRPCYTCSRTCELALHKK